MSIGYKHAETKNMLEGQMRCVTGDETETVKALKGKGIEGIFPSFPSHVTHLQYLTALCTSTKLEKV